MAWLIQLKSLVGLALGKLSFSSRRPPEVHRAHGHLSRAGSESEPKQKFVSSWCSLYVPLLILTLVFILQCVPLMATALELSPWALTSELLSLQTPLLL